MSDKLIEVKNISFSYSKNSPLIFKDISFSIERGDILCVLGPNGTGKTTLIKTLNKLHEINSGEIILNGKNIKKLSFKDISKSIGYIPQGHVPSFPFTVFDVVLMGRSPYISLSSSPRTRDRKIAEDALKTLGIYHMRDKEYTNLSGGERQLVFLARVLAQEPDVLILDEPTNHLDFGNQIKLLQILEQLSQLGMAIIMSSHYPDHALLVANKVAIMKNKTFLTFGKPEEVITEETLKETYDMEVMIKDVGDGRKTCIPLKSDFKLKMDNYKSKFQKKKQIIQ